MAKDIQDNVTRHATNDMAAAPNASQPRITEAQPGIGESLIKGLGNALGQAADRLIPQGRDELANAIFNGSAYWPGEQPTPMTPEPDNGYEAMLADLSTRGSGQEPDKGRGR